MASTDSGDRSKVDGMVSEPVDGIPRNQWTACVGIGGRLGPVHALLVISGLIPSTELLQAIEEHNLEGPLSYEMELDIYETVPADIYFLKSRRNSKIDSANLILKAVGIPAGGLAEVVAVRTGMLKGICTLSERGEKGLIAIAHLYNNKGNVAFTAMLMNYEDEKALKMDLLAVLGGLRLPDQPLNAMAVENDIVALVDKYKRAEPVH
jgi:hypothetical protein